jgi:hypothetical protein
VDYGVREFCLVLTKNTDTDKSLWKLEAKVTKMCYFLEFCSFINILALHIKIYCGRSRSAWNIL